MAHLRRLLGRRRVDKSVHGVEKASCKWDILRHNKCYHFFGSHTHSHLVVVLAFFNVSLLRAKVSSDTGTHTADILHNPSPNPTVDLPCRKLRLNFFTIAIVTIVYH